MKFIFALVLFTGSQSFAAVSADKCAMKFDSQTGYMNLTNNVDESRDAFVRKSCFELAPSAAEYYIMETKVKGVVMKYENPNR